MILLSLTKKAASVSSPVASNTIPHSAPAANKKSQDPWFLRHQLSLVLLSTKYQTFSFGCVIIDKKCICVKGYKNSLQISWKSTCFRARIFLLGKNDISYFFQHTKTNISYIIQVNIFRYSPCTQRKKESCAIDMPGWSFFSNFRYCGQLKSFPLNLSI